MTVMIIGGTGFIGRRLVPLIAQRGEEIVCMDINPQTADYSALGKQVRVVRGDVSQFDDVMARITEAKPDRVVNLAYYIGSDLPPRVAFKLNVLGMDNDTGNDVMMGGEGDDILRGHEGDDNLDGNSGVNSNDGGVGTDYCVNPDTAHGALNCELP